jgi:hypothetical protein
MSTHGGYDYGIEDKILRKNIPGRYSSWEKDEDEEGPKARAEWIDREEGIDESEEDLNPSETLLPPQTTAASSSSSNSSGYSGTTRTGPKGVLQDYKEHQRIEQHNRELTKLENEEKYRKEAYGATRPVHALEFHSKSPAQPDDKDDDNEDDCSESSDVDHELRMLREQRLMAIQAASGMPLFGEVKEVNAMQFLEAVDGEVASTHSLTHSFCYTHMLLGHTHTHTHEYRLMYVMCMGFGSWLHCISSGLLPR